VFGPIFGKEIAVHDLHLLKIISNYEILRHLGQKPPSKTELTPGKACKAQRDEHEPEGRPLPF
jgi:hypothetical protein